jgi:hypothetical protein
MRCYQGGEPRRVADVARRRRGAAEATDGPFRSVRVQRTLRSPRNSELGAVTAEVAVVLPALVVLLALLLGMAHVGAQQLQLEEAARAGAREVMRGESEDSVHRTTRRLAGPDAVTTMTRHDGWSTVEVRATVGGPVIEFLQVRLTASASGRNE